MLREWQKRCIKQVLERYQHQPDALVLATPGSGKTIMASYVAKALLDERKVDYVICFSPSKVVCHSIQKTFRHTLKRPFNGQLGALGTSLTYHSMANINELLSNLSLSRVLVIFDEIHHCAGDGESPSNTWGIQLLSTIQKLATYTLSLTGTPWRTDTLPIPLARYSDPEGNIQCDFSYGLNEAINDSVCRVPFITAIDTDQVMVRKGHESKTYQNISELLESGDVSYRMILKQPEVITYMLSLSIQKLDKLRTNSPNSGGLIVASSYQHALQIQSILYGHFGKEATLVSYRLDDSPELINRFREDTSEWIISIAMISEGTDIPRLQVCCNLTDVTTELYFRQILGRVLRMTNSQTIIGYMFILAEPNLLDYAERLNETIPGSYNYQKTERLLDSLDTSNFTNINQNSDLHKISLESDISLGDITLNDDQEFVGCASLTMFTMSSFKSRIISYHL
ncbi:DEAD/DEAH box helicase [Marinomonas hwangdonensis]|uniref:DEAD/DEAH box helicase n=1 Tax=Marinomonas hwangdonensis TaxID=1053647 RepID=A0A3M8Q983_9GAMM|nr:DEAD/DEAH box helicase family protein [Marinomonas hwangdonensis]RNF52627.1 DEAD/DEAH box helicase [Marinomonas hwangdonensis]